MYFSIINTCHICHTYYICLLTEKECFLKQIIHCGNHVTDWLLNLQKNLQHYIYVGEMWMKKHKKHESHIWCELFLTFAVNLLWGRLQNELFEHVSLDTKTLKACRVFVCGPHEGGRGSSHHPIGTQSALSTG